jgi:hypothetical protein
LQEKARSIWAAVIHILTSDGAMDANATGGGGGGGSGQSGKNSLSFLKLSLFDSQLCIGRGLGLFILLDGFSC